MDAKVVALCCLFGIFAMVAPQSYYDGSDDEDDESYLAPIVRADHMETFTYEDREITIRSVRTMWDEALHVCKSQNGTLAVINTLEKATFFAEMLSETDLVLEDVWVGAKRDDKTNPNGYKWVATGMPLRRLPTDIYIPPATIQDPPTKDFPLWLNRTQVPPPKNGANCVAIERGHHDRPVFIDLECNLERAFACEKSTANAPEVPDFDPSTIHRDSSVTCGSLEYTLFLGSVTFDEAVGYCSLHGMSLASFDSMQCINRITVQMMKSRPKTVENAWIGGRGENGVWKWIHSDKEIKASKGSGPVKHPTRKTTTMKPNKPHKRPSRPARPTRVPDHLEDNFYYSRKPEYPPFRNYLPRKNEGCLLLDRHVCDYTIFLEARCERKKDFICMREISMNRLGRRSITRKLMAADDKYYYMMSPMKLSWEDAIKDCKSKNTHLAHITNKKVLTQLLLLMAESPAEPIDHLWVSGQVKQMKGSEFAWFDPNVRKTIPGPNDTTPSGEAPLPWCDTDIKPSQGCLNLDREDHLTGLLYGLGCKKKQNFICLMDKIYSKPESYEEDQYVENSHEEDESEDDESKEEEEDDYNETSQDLYKKEHLKQLTMPPAVQFNISGEVNETEELSLETNLYDIINNTDSENLNKTTNLVNEDKDFDFEFDFGKATQTTNAEELAEVTESYIETTLAENEDDERQKRSLTENPMNIDNIMVVTDSSTEKADKLFKLRKQRSTNRDDEKNADDNFQIKDSNGIDAEIIQTDSKERRSTLDLMEKTSNRTDDEAKDKIIIDKNNVLQDDTANNETLQEVKSNINDTLFFKTKTTKGNHSENSTHIENVDIQNLPNTSKVDINNDRKMKNGEGRAGHRYSSKKKNPKKKQKENTYKSSAEDSYDQYEMSFSDYNRGKKPAKTSGNRNPKYKGKHPRRPKQNTTMVSDTAMMPIDINNSGQESRKLFDDIIVAKREAGTSEKIHTPKNTNVVTNPVEDIEDSNSNNDGKTYPDEILLSRKRRSDIEKENDDSSKDASTPPDLNDDVSAISKWKPTLKPIIENDKNTVFVMDPSLGALAIVVKKN